jgi:hypothetical protein
MDRRPAELQFIGSPRAEESTEERLEAGVDVQE